LTSDYRRDVSAGHLVPYLQWAKSELSNSDDIFKVCEQLSKT
jgi:predicted ATP-grasp superfamily ATP-dependent carboligase